MYGVRFWKKERAQLRFGVQNRSYFENTSPNWSTLVGLIDKHYIIHVIALIFG